MKEKVAKKNAIKAYKAFNSDWTCRGFQYEVGKTYKFDGALFICKRGFHACEKAADCFDYYPFFPGNIKFAKVLCWGEIEKTDKDSMLCCSNIKIVREMVWEEVLKVCNSGNWNSGDCNSGKCNSGNRNSGDYNSGNRNSGDYNSGNWNSGDCNSGDWNSGDCNSGYFNTPVQKQIFCFNKRTKKQKIEFPSFLYFDLTEWVPVATMTNDEKNEHPECDVLGGYLRVLEYKEAFKKSFFEAKKKNNWSAELAKLKAIPNFDYAIFEEISGISKEELEGDSK